MECTGPNWHLGPIQTTFGASSGRLLNAQPLGWRSDLASRYRYRFFSEFMPADEQVGETGIRAVVYER